MVKLVVVAAVVMLAWAAPAMRAGAATYEPNWESLDKRPNPAWFDEAKFGIFIHWGVYSVPAWGPRGSYSEWYWHRLESKDKEAVAFHNSTYGPDFEYQDFAPMFKAEMFDPDHWADIFARSGAKYVVLTSKHHEGYCLWPSAESWNWNSMDVGPHRDLCGELTGAVKKRGLEMGFYYSLYEWYNPVFHADPHRYIRERMLPQLKDLVVRYEPAIIWPDGEWGHPSEVWKSEEFLAWLFNESAVRDHVVVNDRWGKECRSSHGGFFTSEYGHVGGGKELAGNRKWEENRGIGASFGYNRNETIDEYNSSEDLIRLLIETVSKGGNLLLDIGPTGDGRIPVIMQQRLLEIGRWLEVNGEAIYGTQPSVFKELSGIRCARKPGKLFFHILDWPEDGRLVVPGLKNAVTTAYALADTGHAPLPVTKEPGATTVDVSTIRPDPVATVVVLEIEGEPQVTGQP